VSKEPIPKQAPVSGLQPVAQGTAPLPWRPGELVAGKYQVVKLIGEGGVGFVVSAMHKELGEMVALKFLRPEARINGEIVARFSREARAAARIKSEYVARVFDVGSVDDGAPFIVMEYLEGDNLCDVLRERGPLSVRVAVEYVMQACEALSAAHAIGIVHRDIKPENLFLARRTRGLSLIKVLDFGISKVALTGSPFECELPMVQTLLPMGSPVYMSPEQIRASCNIDARTDIWSLGCVIFELLTGSAAFDAPSLTQLSATILEQSPPPLRFLRPDVPPELESVVLRCLEKEPSQRFRNVAELAVALYPFAPPRARISAERCRSALENSRLSQADFELPDAAPWSTDSDSSPPLPADTRPCRTSRPATITVKAPLNKPTRPALPRLAGAAGLALALLAAAYVVVRPRLEPGASPNAPAAAANTMRVGTELWIEEPAMPVPAASADTEAAHPPQPASGSAARTSVTPGGASSKSRGSPKRKPATPSRPREPTRDEFDPGF
jgi:eukaryotic-like serine/threonine-protein kinase